MNHPCSGCGLARDTCLLPPTSLPFWPAAQPLQRRPLPCCPRHCCHHSHHLLLLLLQASASCCLLLHLHLHHRPRCKVPCMKCRRPGPRPTGELKHLSLPIHFFAFLAGRAASLAPPAALLPPTPLPPPAVAAFCFLPPPPSPPPPLLQGMQDARPSAHRAKARWSLSASKRSGRSLMGIACGA